jgi:hypothetical protein
MIIGSNLLCQGVIIANQKRYPALHILAVLTGESRTAKIDKAATAQFSTTSRWRLSNHLSSLLSSLSTTLVSSYGRILLDAAYRMPLLASTLIVLSHAVLLLSLSCRANTTSTTRVYRTIDPSLCAAIAADLRSVDCDMDGMIDAEELGALLRKHGSTFSEG